MVHFILLLLSTGLVQSALLTCLVDSFSQQTLPSLYRDTTGFRANATPRGTFPDEDDDSERGQSTSEDRKHRLMEQVRSVQDSFYSPSFSPSSYGLSCRSPSAPSSLVRPDGILENLPLFRRVGQTELPGRSTLQYAADPRHTHLLESVVRGGPRPWLIGQLFVPGRDFGDFGVLTGWRDRLSRVDDDSPPAAVVGTVLSVVDYRRVDDGRMVFLTHGLERFVVERPVRDAPYPVADVRIVPDTEDFDDSVLRRVGRRGGTALSAGLALEESILESDCDWRLPGIGEGGEDVSIEALWGREGLGSGGIFPLAPFVLADPRKLASRMVVGDNDDDGNSDSGGGLVSVETELLHYGVLSEYNGDDRGQVGTPPISSEDLERSLWMRIDEYVKARGVGCDVLPPELLRLLPKSASWPKDFELENYAVKNGLMNTRVPDSDRDDSEHASHRRRRRLSYAGTVLLGGTERSTGLLSWKMRRRLLEVPDTAGRMRLVLKCFDEFLRVA